MKITGNDFRALYCGVKVTLVNPSFAYEFKLFCKRWGCQQCREFKIENYWKKIGNVMDRLAGVQLFVATLTLREKDLSNFIQKNIKGLYVSIYTQEEVAIISTRNFARACRRDKRHYLDIELKKVLETSWEEGRRVNCSSEIRNYWKKYKYPRQWLALILSPEKEAYERLETDLDKAVWLANKRDKILFPGGEKFIKENIPEVPLDAQVIRINEPAENLFEDEIGDCNPSLRY